MKSTKIKYWALGIGVLTLLSMLFFMYQLMQNESSQMILIFAMLAIGLLLGGIIVFLFLRDQKDNNPIVHESSHTIAESMRKVFKVVSAEGHFNEIYNYEETTKIFNFIPSKKRALVIVEAKVLVGYDFEKLKWELDPITNMVKLIDFPAPEILSTETDYKYYNIEEQFFNLFSKDDLAKIQQNGKKQIVEAAKRSNLPQVAAEQMRTLLTELLEVKNIGLSNASAISESKYKLIEKP